MTERHQAIYLILDDIKQHSGGLKIYRISLLMLLVSSQISTEMMDDLLEAYFNVLRLVDDPLTGRAV